MSEQPSEPAVDVKRLNRLYLRTMDRLTDGVSPCVDGVHDQLISREFPALLDAYAALRADLAALRAERDSQRDDLARSVEPIDMVLIVVNAEHRKRAGTCTWCREDWPCAALVLRNAYAALRGERDALRRRATNLEQLADYAEHGSYCTWSAGPPPMCSCGLMQLLDSMESPVEAAR